MIPQLPAKIEDIECYDIIKLIRDIIDCLQDDKGNSPFVDIMNEEILMVTFDNKRFRIMVQDCSRFQ